MGSSTISIDLAPESRQKGPQKDTLWTSFLHPLRSATDASCIAYDKFTPPRTFFPSVSTSAPVCLSACTKPRRDVHSCSFQVKISRNRTLMQHHATACNTS